MLVNCIVVDNRARDGNGGGLYNSSAVNCTVVGNSATGNVGGTFADAAGGREGSHNSGLMRGS